MNRYYYAVHNEDNKEQDEYLIGFCYGNEEAREIEILDAVKGWCADRHYRLALLVQTFPLLPIVSQLYPCCLTGESDTCMEYVMQVMNVENC